MNYCWNWIYKRQWANMRVYDSGKHISRSTENRSTSMQIYRWAVKIDLVCSLLRLRPYGIQQSERDRVSEWIACGSYGGLLLSGMDRENIHLSQICHQSICSQFIYSTANQNSQNNLVVATCTHCSRLTESMKISHNQCALRLCNGSSKRKCHSMHRHHRRHRHCCCTMNFMFVFLVQDSLVVVCVCVQCSHCMEMGERKNPIIYSVFVSIQLYSWSLFFVRAFESTSAQENNKNPSNAFASNVG